MSAREIQRNSRLALAAASYDCHVFLSLWQLLRGECNRCSVIIDKQSVWERDGGEDSSHRHDVPGISVIARADAVAVDRNWLLSCEGVV